MTNLADQVIAALRSGFDDMSLYAAKLDESELTGPSGASEWTVAQVLSHLGSGAEIAKAQLERGVEPAPEGFNQGVWARWDSSTPVEQRDTFIVANRALVEAYEAVGPAERETILIDLGFLPAPVSLGEAGRLRLLEFGLHSWDVKVAADPAATVAPEAVPLLLAAAGALLGFIGKPDGRSATLTVTLTDTDQVLGLVLGDSVSLSDAPSSADGTLSLPSEAWLRLLTGRLGAAYTPSTVTVTGPLTLDDLRGVFQGY